MKLKELNGSLNIAWSPTTLRPIYMAAGTAAQQLDASFNTSASLGVFALNLTEPGLDMLPQASVPSDYRFHKVIWGNPDNDAGIIAGGCDGGRIQLYNAYKLLSGEEGLLDTWEKHTGPVQALDFNPLQHNLLASGASESELTIWDMHHMNVPMNPGPKSQPYEDIVWISWNRQVHYILAAVFPQRCVMWDVRKTDPIIKISDSTTRIRWKVAAWHPEVSTQLCLCSEEDQNPVIQLWDLRFATSPLKVLQCHQSGVLSIAWCAQDPDILASCGKDNRILCWNPNSNVEGGEVICDIPTTNRWNFDVSWCPISPGLFSSSSFDGYVSVYSLTGGQPQIQTSTKIADSFPGMENLVQAPVRAQQPATVNLHKAPKWMKKPVGASFGFGGKIILFKDKKVNLANPPGSVSTVVSRPILNCRVMTQPEIVERSEKLEDALHTGQFSDFCRSKLSSSKNAHEQRMWAFTMANFEEDPRAEFLRLLGLKSEEIMTKLKKVIGKPAKSSEVVDSLADQMKAIGTEKLNKRDSSSPRDMPKFMHQGSGDAAEKPLEAFGDVTVNNSDAQSTKPFKIGTGDDTDGLICQALLVGSIEAAVDLCVQNNRMADAIILATAGGPDLLAKTQGYYFQQNPGYLSSLINAVVTNNWTQVIKSCDIESWREVMAALLTQVTEPEVFIELSEMLGQRLENEAEGPHKLNAQFCYIVAGNLNKLVENWTANLKTNSIMKMQDLVELVMVLRKAVERQGRNIEVSENVATLLSEYATMLTDEGSLNAAMRYLGDSKEVRIVNLRERLSTALGQKRQYPKQELPIQQQPEVLGRIPNSRRESATYYTGQGTLPTTYSHPQPAYGMQPLPDLQQASNPRATPQYSDQRPCTPQPPEANVLTPKPRAPLYATDTRKRYTIDPSMHPTAPYPTFVPPPRTATFNSATHSYSEPQVPGYSQHDIYNPGANLPTATFASIAGAKPGWNDPPTILRSSRTQFQGIETTQMSAEHAGTRKWKHTIAHDQPKTEYLPRAPITHPLYGHVPQENTPPVGMPTIPAKEEFGDTGDLYGQPSHKFPSQVFQPQLYSPQQALSTPQPQSVETATVVEPPKSKGPVPEEHMYLQTVFDELRNKCFDAANNPQSRRKLEEVARKLEVLYDSLRENKLSVSTLHGLHQMVQMIQVGNYNGGLHLHTQLVSGPDFALIASFMPGLKILLQFALQLQVYLQ